jgi:hemoglobin/transferrin/lactoferrin receptor protein
MVGSLGAVYRGVPDWAFRANYSMGYRYPTLRQLLGGVFPGGGLADTYLVPNPNLKPETSHNFEIGARYQTDSWNVDLSAFLSKAKNFIHYVNPSGTEEERTYVNMTRASTWGAEASLAYTFEALGARFTPYGNATWLRRKITLPDGRSTSDGKTAPLRGRVGFKFEKPIGAVSLFYGDVYANMAVKTRYNTSEGLNTQVPAINGTTLTSEAWQTLNLTLGVRGGEDHRYNVSLSLRNIFDQTYHNSSAGRGFTSTARDSESNEPGFHVVMSVGFEY